MKTPFYYTVLQYQNNLVSGEVLNVGVLFYFPEIPRLIFVKGNLERIKSAFPGADLENIRFTLQELELRCFELSDWEKQEILQKEFTTFIHQHLLFQDAVGLQFRSHQKVLNVFESPEQAADQYAKFLLSGIHRSPVLQKRITEPGIIKSVTSQIIRLNPTNRSRLIRQKHIHTDTFEVTFGLAWIADKEHWVKPISFDLKDISSIQAKVYQQYGFLDDVGPVAESQNAQVDFLIVPPKIAGLSNTFDKVVQRLSENQIVSRVYLHSHFQEYATEASEGLRMVG